LFSYNKVCINWFEICILSDGLIYILVGDVAFELIGDVAIEFSKIL